MTSVFLIHGWCMPPEIWHDVKENLRRRFANLNIVIGELPGYGTNSSVESTNQSVDPLASLLEQAPPNAHWCGWSLGATISMIASMKHRCSIASLTLVSPTPCFALSDDWPFGVPANNFVRLQRMMRRDFVRGWRAFLALQQSPDSLDSGDSWIDSIVERFKDFSPNLEALQHGMELLLDTDIRILLKEIPVPVQILAGRHDQIVPIDASLWIHRQLPEARFHQFETGHAIPLMEPDGLSAKISSFIMDVAQTSPGCVGEG